MPENLDWTDATVIPAIIARIKTNTAGGWQIVLDVPEIAANQVKHILGTENKAVYSVGLLYLQEIEQPEKRGPGRPRQGSAEEE